MTRAELQNYLAKLSETISFSEETTQYLEATIDRNDWHNIALQLRDDKATDFDFLFCLSGVDWPSNLSVVYHLESTTYRHILVVKVYTEDRENAVLDTVSDIWPTANPHEREVYDLLGVKFTNHPDLKRIFLTEDWVGHPLRKDYVDEVNMIVK